MTAGMRFPDAHRKIFAFMPLGAAGSSPELS
jgi:hypothetical protein